MALLKLRADDGAWSGLKWGSLAAWLQSLVSDRDSVIPDEFALDEDLDSPAA
jgi:hypothetical protein